MRGLTQAEAFTLEVACGSVVPSHWDGRTMNEVIAGLVKRQLLALTNPIRCVAPFPGSEQHDVYTVAITPIGSMMLTLYRQGFR